MRKTCFSVECEIYGLSVLRYHGYGRVLGWLVSCLLSMEGRNWDCSLSDNPRRIAVFAFSCRKPTMFIWSQQGLTLVCLFFSAEKGDRKETEWFMWPELKRKSFLFSTVVAAAVGKLCCQFFLSARRCYPVLLSPSAREGAKLDVLQLWIQEPTLPFQ